MMLVIIATVFYNICQKSINENINPFASMIVTYSVALVCSIASALIFQNKNILVSFKELNWATYILGVAIFVLEIGFLLVYRSGWSINIAPLFANIITTLVLVFVGLYIFKEQLSITNIVGICLSVMGLILMKK
ncbi:EamA family transporter [Tepidibacter aestuarii]|uniref:EamA family transporter n=1 Tax=Tepidibacter aestuarii TaxID=2925782 RepID=UPI0020BDB5C5|nr:hypothetical protein [Tepidibacter aestuarii]